MLRMVLVRPCLHVYLRDAHLSDSEDDNIDEGELEFIPYVA